MTTILIAMYVAVNLAILTDFSVKQFPMDYEEELAAFIFTVFLILTLGVIIKYSVLAYLYFSSD